MDENESTQEPKERSINELIDLPYSEMTDEEIARVVDFKATIKARDDAYIQRQTELREHMEEIAAIHGEMAAKAEAQLKELTAHAINDYKAASNGQA